MKLFFRIIFKIFLILTFLAGCATTEEIKETDPIALLNQGITFGKEGQYDRAIAYFNKAIKINPTYADAYNKRGVAYGKKGQHDKAISDFNKAIELNPTYAEAYNNRGIAYGKKDQYDKAISDFNKAIELNPTYAEAYNNRGKAYGKKGQHDKATADYNKAMELNPKKAETYNKQGHSRFEENTFFCDFPKFKVRLLKNVSRQKEKSQQSVGHRSTSHFYITGPNEVVGITIWRFSHKSNAEWRSSNEQLVRQIGTLPLDPITINNKTWVKFVQIDQKGSAALGYFTRMDDNLVSVYSLIKAEQYKDDMESFAKTRVLSKQLKQLITETFDDIEELFVIE